MNLYNLFEAPKRPPAPGTTGVMDNQVQSAASPIGSGTSRWESKKKPVTMMGVGNNGVVAEARDVQLDEISNKILGDYKKAAGADASAADARGDVERGNKRFKGIVKATIKQGENDAKKHKEQGVAEGSLEANTPNPVVVVQDLKGKILDKVNLSMAVQKYKLGNPQDIKNQLAHQNYTQIGNYVIVSPMSGQPQDNTTQGVAEGVDIGQEWMSDTELDQYVPDQLQQQWRELLGYDRNGNPSALWVNLTGGYEPDVRDPEHRALMVKVANKWFAAKKIPNVKFFNVKDADDELEWLVQIGQQGVAEAKWNPYDQGDFPINYNANDSDEVDDTGNAEKWQAMQSYYGSRANIVAALQAQRGLMHPAHGTRHGVQAVMSTSLGKRVVKTFPNKEKAYDYADVHGYEVVEIKDTGLATNPITLNVVLGHGEHKKQFSLQFPDMEKAQQWADRYHAEILGQSVAEAIPLDTLRSTAGTRVKDEVSAKLKQNGPLGRDAEKAKQNGKPVKPGVAESMGRATPKMPKPRDPGHAVLAAKRSSGAGGQHTNKRRQALLQPKHQQPLTRDMDMNEDVERHLLQMRHAGYDI